MKDIKFRIVNKSKDGVLLSPRKGVEPTKMGWDEFKTNYVVKDGVWAIPTKECVEKINEINKHIDIATTSFFLSGGNTGEVKDLAQLMVMGEEIQKIMELAGCSHGEAMLLVKQRVDSVRNGFAVNKVAKKKHTHKKTEKDTNPKMVSTPSLNTSAVLADNPALLALKEKFNKK